MSNTKQGMSIVHQSLVSKTYSSLTRTSKTMQVGKEKCPIFNSPKGRVAVYGLTGQPCYSFLSLIK